MFKKICVFWTFVVRRQFFALFISKFKKINYLKKIYFLCWFQVQLTKFKSPYMLSNWTLKYIWDVWFRLLLTFDRLILCCLCPIRYISLMKGYRIGLGLSLNRTSIHNNYKVYYSIFPIIYLDGGSPVGDSRLFPRVLSDRFLDEESDMWR